MAGPTHLGTSRGFMADTAFQVFLSFTVTELFAASTTSKPVAAFCKNQLECPPDKRREPVTGEPHALRLLTRSVQTPGS
jgi:hypothetical protein